VRRGGEKRERKGKKSGGKVRREEEKGEKGRRGEENSKMAWLVAVVAHATGSTTGRRLSKGEGKKRRGEKREGRRGEKGEKREGRRGEKGEKRGEKGRGE
jgi:hypothetical protein